MLRRGITRTGSGEALSRRVQTAAACLASHRLFLAPPLHVKCCRGQEVAVRHRNGMFLPGSRSSLQRGPEIIGDHQHAPFFKFPFICCSRFAAGGASVKFTPLNLLHLHHDSMDSIPTGTRKRMTAQGIRLESAGLRINTRGIPGLY